jgi:hypothetical protein
MPNTPSKYIVVDNGLADAFILFPMMYNHSDVARAFPGTVISAGFVLDFGDGRGFQCYGKSISLNISSRPEEDEALLRKQLLPD